MHYVGKKNINVMNKGENNPSLKDISESYLFRDYGINQCNNIDVTIIFGYEQGNFEYGSIILMRFHKLKHNLNNKQIYSLFNILSEELKNNGIERRRSGGSEVVR